MATSSLLLQCVLLTVIARSVYSQSCPGGYRYSTQPPSELNCNPVNGFISLQCISGSSSDTVTWYQTQSACDAGISGTAILPGNSSDNYEVSTLGTTNNKRISFTATSPTLGYYWCEISNAVNVSLRPSTITSVLQPTNTSLSLCTYQHVQPLHNTNSECAAEGSPIVYTRTPLPSSCAIITTTFKSESTSNTLNYISISSTLPVQPTTTTATTSVQSLSATIATTSMQSLSATIATTSMQSLSATIATTSVQSLSATTATTSMQSLSTTIATTPLTSCSVQVTTVVLSVYAVCTTLSTLGLILVVIFMCYKMRTTNTSKFESHDSNCGQSRVAETNQSADMILVTHNMVYATVSSSQQQNQDYVGSHENNDGQSRVAETNQLSADRILVTHNMAYATVSSPQQQNQDYDYID